MDFPEDFSAFKRLIDLAYPIGLNTPVYPGDPAITIYKQATIEKSGYALSQWDVNFHTGTHMDAPSHFISDGASISALGPSLWMGKALVIPCAGKKTIGMDCINIETIRADVDFLLFKTSWEYQYGTPAYFSNHPTFSDELGQWLAASPFKGIGMDMPSPDQAPYPIHQLILGAGMVLIENLRNLDQLPENKLFQLICIPLPIEAEAVWVRPLAVLPLL